MMINKTAAVFLILLITSSCAHKNGTAPAEPTAPVAEQKPAEVKNGDAKTAEAKPAPTPAPTPKGPRPEFVADTSLHPRGIDFGATIKSVAFGSSANQNQPQPLWTSIAENKPDLFLFLGDNVQITTPEPKSLTAQYRKLDTIAEYRSFRESVPFMATWDDQDFGAKEFLKYWTYVGNSTSFGQKGIHHAKIIGPKNKQVQIIMLDTRTFRTAADDPKATLLGEAQWDWLEAQLKRPAQVRILASSIPVIANSGNDKWMNFPKERQRLFDLLKKTGVRNLVVVSGDRRQSSIAKTGVKEWGMLFDITASPINMPAATADEDSSFEGKAYPVESFGMAQIDWHDHKMSFQIRDAKNQILNSISFKVR
jgi:alkaline phosphatase D